MLVRCSGGKLETYDIWTPLSFKRENAEMPGFDILIHCLPKFESFQHIIKNFKKYKKY